MTLSGFMTLSELLRDCRDAFRAIDSSTESRVLLKQRWGLKPKRWQNGRNALARHMIQKIEEYFPEEGK